MGSIKKANKIIPAMQLKTKSKQTLSSKGKKLNTFGSSYSTGTKNIETKTNESQESYKSLTHTTSNTKVNSLRSKDKQLDADFEFFLSNEVPELLPLIKKFKDQEGDPRKLIAQMDAIAKKKKGAIKIIAKAAIVKLFAKDSNIKFERLKTLEQLQANLLLKRMQNKDDGMIFFSMNFLENEGDFFDIGQKQGGLAADVAASRVKAIKSLNKRIKDQNKAIWKKASTHDKFLYNMKADEKIQQSLKNFGEANKATKRTLDLYKIHVNKDKYNKIRSEYINAKTPEAKEEVLKKAHKFALKLGAKEKDFDKVKQDLIKHFES